MWAQTEGGKRMPLDAEDLGGWDAPAPTPTGNLVIVDSVPSEYGPVPVVAYVTEGEGKYVSHFSTCPEAQDWRKPRPRKRTP